MNGTKQIEQLAALYVGAVKRCARCGASLTDAASVVSGFGPECRQKANALLAREIPMDASHSGYFGALTLMAEQFPPVVRPVYEAVMAVIFPPVAQPTRALPTGDIFSQLAGVGETKSAGNDYRQAVRWLAFLAACTYMDETRNTIYLVIEALGYVAYAAYLQQHGSPTAGQATFNQETGYLELTGVRNKAGFQAFQAIPNYTNTTRQGGGEKNFRHMLPASEAAAFERVVKTYWPFSTGVEKAVAESTCTNAPSLLPIYAERGEKVVVVKPPFNATFNIELRRVSKTKFWTSRGWSVAVREWEQVKALLGRCFPKHEVRERAA